MRKLKIISPLLIENRNQTELLQKIFEENGHDLCFVTDTEKILSVEETHPDLILLEPSLYHWHWLGLLIKLRKDHAEIPVILYSSAATVENGFANLTVDEAIFLVNDAECLADNLKQILAKLKTPKKKILFVDDDENTLKSYRRLLRKSNWHVLLASSGENALEQIRTGSIDLVITDIKMPNMHGITLISEIRKTNRDLPIIVSSGYLGMKEDSSLKFHEIAGFIEKPIDCEVLEKTIDTLLN